MKAFTKILFLIFWLPLMGFAQNQSLFIIKWNLGTLKYATQRKNLVIPETIQPQLQILKNEYDKKLQALSKNPANQKVLQIYSTYPDISAVLLNRGDQFTEKISDDEKNRINSLTTDIWKLIPNPLYNKISDLTDEMNRGKFHLTFPYRFDEYRMFFDDTPRKKNDVLNFLIWNP